MTVAPLYGKVSGQLCRWGVSLLRPHLAHLAEPLKFTHIYIRVCVCFSCDIKYIDDNKLRINNKLTYKLN